MAQQSALLPYLLYGLAMTVGTPAQPPAHAPRQPSFPHPRASANPRPAAIQRGRGTSPSPLFTIPYPPPHPLDTPVRARFLEPMDAETHTISPIQRIVREETQDGRLIVRFLVAAMQDRYATPGPTTG